MKAPQPSCAEDGSDRARHPSANKRAQRPTDQLAGSPQKQRTGAGMEALLVPTTQCQ